MTRTLFALFLLTFGAFQAPTSTLSPGSNVEVAGTYMPGHLTEKTGQETV